MDFLEQFRFQGGSPSNAAASGPQKRHAEGGHQEDNHECQSTTAKKKKTTTAECCFVHTSPQQSASSIQPYIAPAASGGWRERFSSCCEPCFREAVPCPHFNESPLALLLIGHNPSEHSWQSGLPYSNPTNRFYNLLRLGKVVPDTFTARDANRMPAELGVGVTDLGLQAGSDANVYGKSTMRRWAACLLRRLEAHLHRAGGQPPAIVAFTGKRHFSILWEGCKPAAEIAALPFGRQNEFPPLWPFDPHRSELWLLRSSSGRAAMTTEERNAPYECLGRRLAEVRREQVESKDGVSPGEHTVVVVGEEGKLDDAAAAGNTSAAAAAAKPTSSSDDAVRGCSTGEGQATGDD
jgi:TDG/mug DNA glycosylase family protein